MHGSEHGSRFRPEPGIDPDPFVVATVSMAAAALVLQLVQTWRALSPTPPAVAVNVQVSPIAAMILNQLEDSVAKMQADLKALHRSIDRGSRASDAEFYDSPYRVAATSLNLDQSTHIQFQPQLGTAFGTLGTLSSWINHIIRDNPEAAARLGSRISGGLDGTARVLNEAMAKGSPNRVVIAEAKLALEALAKAIEAELDDRAN